MENGSGSKPAKYIIVNLPDHKITVTEGGNTVRFLNDFSTGKEGHLTPMFKNGSIAIDKRYKMYHSHHYNDHNGKPAEMPFALFFADGSGCAFHAGNPELESHGCIHLSLNDAEMLFNWAGKDPVGLDIIGPNPHKVGPGD